MKQVGKSIVFGRRYHVSKVLGVGSTSTVYEGIDELLNRRVAIKAFDALPSQLNNAARHRIEMLALAAVQHPNLVMVYDAQIAKADSADADGHSAPPSEPSYLVLELVAGTTLSARLQDGPLHRDEVFRLGVALADALSALHDALLVHRDLKPGNVLITAGGTVKLSDFGLVRMLGEPSTVTLHGDVMGTAAYLSPEQVRSADVGMPSDIYSLGLILLECLTGRRAFTGEPAAAALARLERDPEVPDDLPEPWPALLRAMTDADPGRRPSAADVRSKLRIPAFQHQLIPASPVTRPQLLDPAPIVPLQEVTLEPAADPSLPLLELLEAPARPRSRAASLRRFLVAASAATLIMSGSVVLANLHNTNAAISPFAASLADAPSSAPGITEATASQAVAPSAPSADIRRGLRGESSPAASSTIAPFQDPSATVPDAPIGAAAQDPVIEPVVAPSVAPAANPAQARTTTFSASNGNSDSAQSKSKNNKAKQQDKTESGPGKDKTQGKGNGKKRA